MKKNHSSDNQPAATGHHSLDTWGAVLAIVSTILGGGIVALPYSILHLGIPLGVAMVIGLAMQAAHGSIMLIKASKMIPDRPESFYEVGFMLYRRFSIFYISFIMFVNSFGLIVVYFIVFGDISISLHKAITNDEDEDLVLN